MAAVSFYDVILWIHVSAVVIGFGAHSPTASC